MSFLYPQDRRLGGKAEMDAVERKKKRFYPYRVPNITFLHV
jgi:hypothetical protein